MVRGGVLKWTLKKAFSELIPNSIINRPKHGFNVPIDHWLRNECASYWQEAFSPSSKLIRSGILKKDAYKEVCEMLDDPLKAH